MAEQPQVRRAVLVDTDWIVDLSACVQEALIAAGSLQQIGPLPAESVERSIRAGHAYILEMAGQRVGSVLVDPLERSFPLCVQMGLQKLSGPLWYLHSLMLEPGEQGRGLGLLFLEDVKWLVLSTQGMIILDCWAGNVKLRDFYERAGFTFHGIASEKDYEVAVFFLRHEAALPVDFVEQDGGCAGNVQ